MVGCWRGWPVGSSALVLSRRNRAPACRVIPAGGDLHCYAPHPDADRRSEYDRQTHGVRLPATLPVPVRMTRRVLSDLGDVRPDCYGIRCTCGAVLEFEVVEYGAAA